MKTISLRSGLLHVETPLGIVNITAGLADRKGRAVDSIEVLPTAGAGELKVVRRGLANTRFIQLETTRI